MSLLRLQSEPSSCSPRTAVRQLMPVFRIATFNVLCGYSFGPCAWSERQQLIHRSIEAARPDVLGLQEISSSRLADAADLVAPLTLVQGPSTGPARWFRGAVGSERDRGGEHLPIVYRADRFRLHDSGGFWISATSDRPRPMQPLARAPFLVHWARLTSRDLSGSLLVMNSHFWHTPWHHAPTAQVVTAQLGALHAASPGRSGTNGNMQSVCSGAGLVDVARFAAVHPGPPVTYHWGRDTTRFGMTLDYVLARTPLCPEAIDVHEGGLNPFDHQLLVLEVDQDQG
jgi:hypothetical protein